MGSRAVVDGRVIRHRTSMPASHDHGATVERPGSHRCNSPDHSALHSRTQQLWSCRTDPFSISQIFRGCRSGCCFRACHREPAIAALCRAVAGLEPTAAHARQDSHEMRRRTARPTAQKPRSALTDREQLPPATRAPCQSGLAVADSMPVPPHLVLFSLHRPSGWEATWRRFASWKRH
jgi:hypothetical protein